MDGKVNEILEKKREEFRREVEGNILEEREAEKEASKAAENDKLIEINTTPKRLDLDWQHLKYAREKGVKISINPDAHSLKGLDSIALGVRMARKGGFTSGEVINAKGVDEMKKYLQTRRAS